MYPLKIEYLSCRCVGTMKVLEDIIRRKLVDKYYGAECLPQTSSNSDSTEAICVFGDQRGRIIKCKNEDKCPLEPETSPSTLARIGKLCKGVSNKSSFHSEQLREISSVCLDYYDLVGSKRLFNCFNNCNRSVAPNSTFSTPDLLQDSIPKKTSSNKRVTFARPDCHLPAKKRALINDDGTPTLPPKPPTPVAASPKVPIFNESSKEQLFEAMKNFTDDLFIKQKSEKNRRTNFSAKRNGISGVKIDESGAESFQNEKNKEDLKSKRKKMKHHRSVSPKIAKTIVKKSVTVQWKHNLDKKIKKQLLQKHMENAKPYIEKRCQEVLRKMLIRDQSAQGVVHPICDEKYVERVKAEMSRTWSIFVPLQELCSEMDHEWLCNLTAKITKSMRQRKAVEQNIFNDFIVEYDMDNVEPRFAFSKRKPFRSFTVVYEGENKKKIAEVCPKDSNTPDYDGIFDPSVYREKANRFDRLVNSFRLSIDDKLVYCFNVRHLFLYCVDSAYGDIHNTIRDLYSYQVHELPPHLPTPNALVAELIGLFRKRGSPQEVVMPRHFKDPYRIFHSREYLMELKRKEEGTELNDDPENVQAVKNLQTVPCSHDESDWPVYTPMQSRESYGVYQQHSSEPTTTYSPIIPSTLTLSSCKYVNNNGNVRFANNNSYAAAPQAPQPLPPLQTILKRNGSIPSVPSSDSSESPPDVFTEILATPMAPDFSQKNLVQNYNRVWHIPPSAVNYGRSSYVTPPQPQNVEFRNY
uniref:Uncharacterized protein n=1 Tax=Romanomermis culicivorax TaxID=13658 RepID=A0A915K6V1_ROMCU